MYKGILFIWLMCCSFMCCQAQENPNAMNDSINARAKRLNDSINAGAKRMHDSINAIDKSMRDHIVKPDMPVIPQKPTPPQRTFATGHDTAFCDSLHGKLTIMVRNINNTRGTLNIALFNSFKSFAAGGPVYKGKILPVTGTTMTVIFDSIPQGTYSVALYHDEDKNGLLARNKLNIPTEGYGFSNVNAVKIGPPTYSEIKFYYSGLNMQIRVPMLYFKVPK
jgi:uncharacterized protein (DUF2141 family)